MAKLNDVFPSDYLKAEDIPEEGMVVTISKVEIKELGQGKDKQTKPVITLEETDKWLVCNKTNCGTIAKLTGSDDTDDWAGLQLKLITMEVQFGADLVNSIRVSTKPVKAKAAPKKATTAQAEEEDSEIPF